MYQIDLQIKALAPLAINRWKPGGSISETEDYIPGSVLRGAIAGQILREAGRTSENLTTNGGDFSALFLGDCPAIFRNAYPANIPDKPVSRGLEVRYLPATALSSKANPGFKTSSDAEGVFDTLIDRYCAQVCGHLYDPCTPNGDRTEAFSGLYCCLGKNYYTPKINKRLLTRVGINRRRATAEEEILYSTQVLNESKRDEPVCYHSVILVPNEGLAQQLQQYINDRASQFRIGGSKSRGLGAVEILASVPVIKTPNVRSRVEAFNQALQQRWQQWGIFGPARDQLAIDRTFFTLNLQADAILVDNWQRTTVISPELLQQVAHIADDSLHLEVAYSSYDYRGGWNAAWGLMKDIELITNKGGTYLYSTTNPEMWFSALEHLELLGVGERTSEGFGQVRICDEFHLILRENAV
ncbi:type III-D CRISPR-associated RAMP protein Csx10 [Trichothermofontia sp.]